ncbi:MAG: hypothetical protein JSV56_00700 [Methanomassiliicoccales archaeon]|nr:MAG: hypothetical protein JSV56_00700 [Methanomassiliicoccales archaeon]
MRKRQSSKTLIFWILLCVIICLTSSSMVSAEGPEQSVKEAIDSGDVSVRFSSTGAASGHIANVVITSNADSDITLNLKNSGLEGLVLENPYLEEQDEVITDTPGTSQGGATYTPADNVTIGSGKSVIVPVMGYCMNFDKATPSQNIEFSLTPTSDKTSIQEISRIVDTIDDYPFPENFTSGRRQTVEQMAIWCGQSENKDTSLSKFEDRGYDLNDEDIEVVKDILTQSGKSTQNIEALSGKEKEEAGPLDDFPMVYTVMPIIIVVIILVFILSRRGKKKEAPKPQAPQRTSRPAPQPQKEKAPAEKIEEPKEEPKVEEEKLEGKEKETEELGKEEEPEQELPEEPEIEDEDKEEKEVPSEEEEMEMPEIEEDLLERDEAEDKTPEDADKGPSENE